MTPHGVSANPDLYASLILPALAAGLTTQADLDVPSYALTALQREGLVRMRMRTFKTTTGGRFAVE